MNQYIECDVYQAPSRSGGKVWAIPTGKPSVDKSFHGKLRRYRDGALTVSELAIPRNAYATTTKKRNDGYTFMERAWINGFGQVSATNPHNKPGSGLKREPDPPKASPSELQIKGEGVFNF